jgi:hypothetical protein
MSTHRKFGGARVFEQLHEEALPVNGKLAGDIRKELKKGGNS